MLAHDVGFSLMQPRRPSNHVFPIIGALPTLAHNNIDCTPQLPRDRSLVAAGLALKLERSEHLVQTHEESCEELGISSDPRGRGGFEGERRF